MSADYDNADHGMAGRDWQPARSNLSAWALSHQTLILFLILVSMVAGVFAYLSLGRAEDPPFTFKVMTIRTEWPGATAREVEQLVTDPIEKKLEEVPFYDYARSYSKPGESVVFLTLKDSTPPARVQELWYQARKKIGDIHGSLPSGVQGPFFNDEFGDVYSAIYGFSGADFSPDQLKKIIEEARERLLRVPGVEKADLIAPQEQKIFVELSARRLATFGVSVQQVMDAIRRDNDVQSSGNVDVGSDRVFVRVDVGFDKAASVRSAPLQIAGKQLTVGDVADIKRGYVDPKELTMRVNGHDAVGLGIVMSKGDDVLSLGKRLELAMAEIRRNLPAGVTVEPVADQPQVVERSVGEFVESLAEALAIVMAVSFLSLGWRTGIIVALAVPLVLALTMVAMLILHIDLQRISLGALIISLGLLVDDAIIAVEMMVVKMEQGWDRLKAGAYAYASTALPMLTGTVVTAAGFVPVGFAASSAGEYTGSIFWVVSVSLGLSWIVAVIFTPYLGQHLLPAPKAHHELGDVYGTPIYRRIRHLIEVSVRHRWVTIGITVGLFVVSMVAFGFVQQQFFPSSNRPELFVDIRLAEGSSFQATETQVKRMEQILAKDPNVVSWVAYTGGGAPRFYLPMDQQLQDSNFAQVVVLTKGLAERPKVQAALEALAPTGFPDARIRIHPLENGPPVGFPVQFRVTGGDPARLREIAYQVRERMRANPHLADVQLDWDEKAKRVQVEVDLTKARALGLAKQDLANALQLALAGTTVTQYREGTELIDVVLRTPESERLDLAGLADLPIGAAGGVAIPLGQVATLHYGVEDPILWRRSRQTTMIVRADVADGVQAPVVSKQIDPTLDALRASLPDGYRIDIGGAIEESAKGNASIVKMLPLMLVIMVTVMMVQLQSFARLGLVLLTAPLGIIGVAGALLISGLPFGFVALLGVIALAGIIMRNSIILVDQIRQDTEEGHTPWNAVIDATVRRARPIALTAAAAILAMIPLAGSAFWGPMAVAIMGGLTVATFLTIFFLPALYAAFFNVRPPEAVTMPKRLAYQGTLGLKTLGASVKG